MQDKKVPFWRRALQGEENLLGLLGVRLRHGVVLFLVDVARRLVLFLVDLLLFASRQRAAIGFAVAGYVLVDALLLFFELSGFTRSELAALDAIGDAVLLILFALRDAGIRLLLGFLCRCWH